MLTLFEWLRRLMGYARFYAYGVSRFAVSMASPFDASLFEWLTPFLWTNARF